MFRSFERGRVVEKLTDIVTMKYCSSDQMNRKEGKGNEDDWLRFSVRNANDENLAKQKTNLAWEVVFPPS